MGHLQHWPIPQGMSLLHSYCLLLLLLLAEDLLLPNSMQWCLCEEQDMKHIVSCNPVYVSLHAGIQSPPDADHVCSGNKRG